MSLRIGSIYVDGAGGDGLRFSPGAQASIRYAEIKNVGGAAVNMLSSNPFENFVNDLMPRLNTLGSGDGACRDELIQILREMSNDRQRDHGLMCRLRKIGGMIGDAVIRNIIEVFCKQYLGQ